MKKTYDPNLIESQWTQYWEAHDFAAPSGQGQSYCIALPPPNVTGTLHMGHGFQQTLMDALIRQHRMKGHNTLWQGGTDHAGIATQMVVERQLTKSGQSRHDLGREKFIERVWQWRQQSGSTITQQIRRLGASIDWPREKFSMDDNITHATTEAFRQLHEEGLIYRGKRLVNWDTKLGTAIADLEVENIETEGHMWYIRYPLSTGSEHLMVATTRPETMLGDTAVAVHPEDERYQHCIGKTIRLPLTNRLIPIIADAAVDPAFGTGCVKITPAHDFNDYEMGQRHDLPIMTIFTFDGHLTHHVPEQYRGLERFEARKKIVDDLKTQGLLEKVASHRHAVPHGDRSGTVIEPMLTDQWFVKAKELAKPAIKAVLEGEIKFVPSNWSKTYLQWLENIEDWCISRQIWWGHRIPVWYDSQSNIYVGHNEEDVRKRYDLAKDLKLEQDSDVLDTWFTAALWPFSSLGWPETTEDLQAFYPTNVLVTGFDIIFFWVARMVMMGIKIMGQVPFKEVYITGLIRDSHGQKMSKSKGNILDPIDLIDGIDLTTLLEKRTATLMQPKMAEQVNDMTKKEFPDGIAAHGTDALRFTFCALATTGRDINFDMGRIDGYRNFCNKLWNAARYVLLNTENQDLNPKDIKLSLVDRWILSRLQHTIEEVNRHFENYRFDLLAQVLYEFTWNEYCDWYLELSKCILNNDHTSEEQLRGTRYTLVNVLETLLRLMHPIMPFITEEIWQKVSAMIDRGDKTIMTQAYPEKEASLQDSQAEDEIEWLKALITNIRTIRSEMNVPPGKKIQLIFDKGNQDDRQRLESCQDFLKSLARIDQVSWHQNTSDLPASAKTGINSLDIHIPLAGLIDKTAELSRLNKEIAKCQKEQQKAAAKLANPGFAKKAPEAVIQQENQRYDEFKNTLEKLVKHKERIENIT
jgi:valyl-tRNA synthetase